MERIKCPSCGSSAQVTLMWNSSSNYFEKTVKGYECGCGCKFDVTFKAVKVTIVEKGD